MIIDCAKSIERPIHLQRMNEIWNDDFL